MGFDLPRQSKKSRELAYLSIDSSYASKLIVGNGGFALKTMQGEDINTAVAEPESSHTAFINGGFYNLNRLADDNAMAWASIGPSSARGQSRPSTALPAGYAADYHQVNLDDGSYLQAAPLLAQGGRAAFTAERLGEARFQFANTANLPGELGHSDTPNTRSAISFPANNGEASGRTRLVLGVNTGLRNMLGNGYTMPEWSGVLARLDRMNASPGWSVNLDGGDSSTIGVVSRSGVIEMQVGARGNPGRGMANFIAFHRRQMN